MEVLNASSADAVVRYCPVCDGFEAIDKRIAVYGPPEASSKARFLRGYSPFVTLVPTTSPERNGGEEAADFTVAPTPAAKIKISKTGVDVHLNDGQKLEFDVLYPALGCCVHSDLATSLGAEANWQLAAAGIPLCGDRPQAAIETTPGPLIMVLQFVGFMGAFRAPGALDSMVAGTLGGLLATWVTFTPCFLWIFIGAPYVEALRGNKALSAALATITAAVVGVVLNLAVWFALHALFADLFEMRWFGMKLEVPVLSSVNIPSLILTLAALIAVFRFKANIIAVLAGCSAIGLAHYFATGQVA